MSYDDDCLEWITIDSVDDSAGSCEEREYAMITYVDGSLFESPARVLVNTVNTVGVMGKGIAKEFKSIFPEMFREYQKHCESGALTVGKLWLYKSPNKWVLNFPTKTTWRKPSEPEYIERGLQNFVNNYASRGITNVAFPPLGCGNGELSWEDQARPMMESYLNKLPIDIFVHLYSPGSFEPEHRDTEEMKEWLRSEPRSLGFVEVWQDLMESIKFGIGLATPSQTQKFSVEVEQADDREGLILKIADREEFIDKEQMMDLWALIRTYGYCMESIMPSGLEPYTEYLVALLERLPYCRRVKIDSDYESLQENGSSGIQWLPPTSVPGLWRKPPVEVGPA